MTALGGKGYPALREMLRILVLAALFTCLVIPSVSLLGGCQATSTQAASTSEDPSLELEVAESSSRLVDETPMKVYIASTRETSGPFAELAALYALDHSDVAIELYAWATMEELAQEAVQYAPPTIIAAPSSKTMELLSNRGLVDEATIYDLVRDPLVVITAREGTIASLTMEELLSGRYTIALAPDSSVMGMASRQSLATYGAYSRPEGFDGVLEGAIASRSVTTIEDDVAPVFSAVAEGKCELGIVTASDVYAFGGVRILSYLPVDSYTPIYYPVALSTASEGGKTEDTRQVAWDFLRWSANDPEATRIWGKWGFVPVA